MTQYTIRYWDLAGNDTKTACYTAGVLMSVTPEGLYTIEDVVRGKWTPFERDSMIYATTYRDGMNIPIYVEQEPGSASDTVIHYYQRDLAGWIVLSDRPRGDKNTRIMPFAAQVQAGHVRLRRGAWNEAYLQEMTAIPYGRFRDQADASSGAFHRLAVGQHLAIGRAPAALVNYRG